MSARHPRSGSFVIRALRESQLFQGVALWRIKPSAALRKSAAGPHSPAERLGACEPAEAVDPDFGDELRGDARGSLWEDTTSAREPNT